MSNLGLPMVIQISVSKCIEKTETKLFNKLLKLVELNERQLVFEQKTAEWLNIRKNYITSSDFSVALGDCGIKARLYLLQEKITGEKIFKGNYATNRGVKYEDVSRKIYSYRTGKKVYEFGLLKDKEMECLGGSPDGVDEDLNLIEIKNPVNRDILNHPSKKYWAQVILLQHLTRSPIAKFIETKFKEYTEFDTFLEEFSNPQENNIKLTNYKSIGKITRSGCSSIPNTEHGCVLTIGGGIDRPQTYIYSQVYSNTEFTTEEVKEKLLNWIETETNKVCAEGNRIECNYWKLTTFSCYNVFYPEIWFNQCIPKIKDFMKDLEYYKTHIPELHKIIEKYPQKRERKEDDLTTMCRTICIL